MKQKLLNGIFNSLVEKKHLNIIISVKNIKDNRKTNSYCNAKLFSILFFLLIGSVSIKAQAVLSFISPKAICSGQTATMKVTIAGGTSPYKITYTQGGVSVNRINYLSGSSIVVAPGATTTYVLTAVVDAKNVSIPVSGSAIITVNPKPLSPFITASDKTIFCAGESVILTSSQGPAGSTYKWTPGNATTQEITAVSSGNYTVQITSNGCTSNSSIAKVVTVNPKSTAPTIETITQPTCLSNIGSIKLNNLPATGTWTINPGIITGSGNTTTLTSLNPGIYNYTVTDENGCISTASADVTIIPPTFSLVAPILHNSVSGCNQTSYNLGWDLVENAFGYKLDVATDADFTSFLTGYHDKELRNVTSETITGINPGITYYMRLRVFDGCGVSQNSNVITVLIPFISPPIASIVTQPTCLEATGSVVIENLPTAGNWAINPGNVTGTGSSTTLSGLVAGTYQFTVTNENECVSEPTADIIISSQFLTPSIPVLNSQTIGCQSSFVQTWEASENATGYILDIATDSDFTTFLTGYQNKELGNVNSETVTGILTGIPYYVRIKSFNDCATSLNSSIITVSPVITTYENDVWSNGFPDSSKSIIFNSNYTVNENIHACSCQVNAAVSVTVQPDIVLTLERNLKVVETGNLIFENNASLVQVFDDAVNTGSISYRRNADFIKDFDYVYWCSPVKDQQLNVLSPNSDKYYSWSVSSWLVESGTNKMNPAGKGFIIRVPRYTNLQAVQFKGVPYNGLISIPSQGPKNSLIGNPYASAIDADLFITHNASIITGALNFWTHNTARGINESGTAYQYANDYSIYNLTGGTKTTPFSDALNGAIAAGQAFMVTNTPTTGNFEFTNSMRIGVSGSNSQFFKQAITKKTALIDKNRIWLNLANTGAAFKQLLIGYISGATNDFDNLYDAVSSQSNAYVDFYTINDTKNYTIEGRALPFDQTDVIPLGYKTTLAGTFEIKIDHSDGLLTNQMIYLEDLTTHSFYNLTEGSYSFSTLIGTFNDRFVLHYLNPSESDKMQDITKESNLDNKDDLNVVVNKNQIHVNAIIDKIEKVVIYDINGKSIYENNSISTNSLLIDKVKAQNQVLIVKTTLKNGKITSDKIIF